MTTKEIKHEKSTAKKFDSLYQKHLNALRRQGKTERTVDSYARAVRRISTFFDICPDQLNEVERMINSARELRYPTIILTIYSMGLRLGEALKLKVGDIDSERMKVHARLVNRDEVSIRLRQMVPGLKGISMQNVSRHIYL